MLESYITGRWVPGKGDEVSFVGAAAGATVGGRQPRLRAAVDFGRDVGGPALRELTFHHRAVALKNLVGKLEASKDEWPPVTTPDSSATPGETGNPE